MIFFLIDAVLQAVLRFNKSRHKRLGFDRHQNLYESHLQRDVIVEGLSLETVLDISAEPKIAQSQSRIVSEMRTSSDPEFISFVGSKVRPGVVTVPKVPVLSTLYKLGPCRRQYSVEPCQKRILC
jgi:hypothetical protein